MNNIGSSFKDHLKKELKDLEFKELYNQEESMNAFEMWFQREFKDDIEAGARELFRLIEIGPEDNIVWSYLGDGPYTEDTFTNASKHILSLK